MFFMDLMELGRAARGVSFRLPASYFGVLLAQSLFLLITSILSINIGQDSLHPDLSTRVTLAASLILLVPLR